MMLDLMGRSDIKPEFTTDRKLGPVGRRRGGVAKAKATLGFETKVGLRQGLTELIAWRREIKKKRAAT